MLEKTYAGIDVSLNEQGYLTNMDEWTREVGEAIAGEEGITMTDKHWEVIEYLRAIFLMDVNLKTQDIAVERRPCVLRESWKRGRCWLDSW